MTRSRDIADQQKNLGGAVAPYVAGKNAVINGGMDIFQRSTTPTTGLAITPTTSTSFYGLDRWQIYAAGYNRTVSRQATNDTTNLPFIQYCQRIARNNGETSTGTTYLAYSLETADSIKFAAKVATLSFYARAGANYSATSSLLYAVVYSGTGTDQNLNTVFTGQATIGAANLTLTSTWQRFTVITNSIATYATQLGIQFQTSYNGTAGANDYYEITGVQLEVGSVATPFSRAGGSIGGELALCQRYYWRNTASPSNTVMACAGLAENSATAVISIVMPTELRTAATSIEFSSLRSYDGSSLGNVTNATIGTCTSKISTLNFTTNGLGTGNSVIILANTSGTPYIGISAEL